MDLEADTETTLAYGSSYCYAAAVVDLASDSNALGTGENDVFPRPQ